MQNPASQPGTGGHTDLAALEARVRDDLDLIAHPRMPWLSPRCAPDGSKALDVLIVGGGQSGVAMAFGLKRWRVDNILVVDKAPRGLEGPWRTYARMRTLRSPKDYTGPDLDIPSLTYPAWHVARYGRQSWAELGLIPRELWAEYLLWVRDMTEVPVRNDVELTEISPAGDLLAAKIRRPDGLTETVFARKVVLATGQDSTGVWWMPPAVAALPECRRAHAADEIDFARLAGKTVAILGAGASAFDNAAVALEAGAREVVLFCRRARLQVIQPYRWLTFRGFLAHLGDLDDAWRWRFMRHILGLREGFPQETLDRCTCHPNFRIVTGAPWEALRETGNRVTIDTPKGQHEADFVIAGTGMENDFSARSELGQFADNIATWANIYTPPNNERDDRLGRFPYLNPEFAFVEKVPGRTPWIANIHLFSISSTMSFGPSGSSINAMTTVVPKLVAALTRGLFRDDVDAYWASLQAYDEPQAVLDEPPE
jgi:FAD-dependent urate hydroxylase